MNTISHHPSYHAYARLWSRCRTVIDGQDAVKQAGERFLPRLTGQSDEDYAAYLLRTSFYGATAKTLSALSGMTTRKSPKLTVPPALREWTRHCDRQGNSLDVFVEELMTEKITTGRVGVLVDRPQLPPDASLAQEQPPYLALYPAEDIINWHYDENLVLDMVTLREVREELHPTTLSTEEVEYHRVLSLLSGSYRQELYRKGVLESVNTPLLDNAPLTSIPFFFKHKVAKPPLLDICNLNLAHYRMSADYAHLLHFSAIPTFVITGVNAENDINIGSEAALVLPNAEATARWESCGSEGAAPHRQELSDLEDRMSALGATLLQNKVDRETATAANIRLSQNTSFIVLLSSEISSTMTKALTFVAEWMGLPTEGITFTLDTDFNVTPLPAAELQILTQALQTGAISAETYVWNIERGEYLPPTATVSEEVARLEALPASDQQNFSLSMSGGSAAKGKEV